MTTLQTLIDGLLPLSGAQVWLLAAALVFTISVVMMFVIFWQFRQHQSNLRLTEEQQPELEAMLVDMNKCTRQARYPLKHKPVMIGRMPANDSQRYDSIVIEDATVGRCHATIEHDDGVYWVRDQGSVNGCFVNGRRIDGACRLKKGDFIKFHKFNFQFMDGISSNIHQPSDGLSTSALYSSTSFPSSLDTGTNSIQGSKRQASDLSELCQSVKEHVRTQVLSRDEVNGELRKVPSHHESTNPELSKEEVREPTVRLVSRSPRENEFDEDKTMRLYSEDLGGPPLIRPSTKVKPESKKVENKPASEKISKSVSGAISEPETSPKVKPGIQLVPDMDQKVIDALGDFFSDTLDDIEIPGKLELTEKGSGYSETGPLSKLPGLKVVNERKGKEHDS